MVEVNSTKLTQRFWLKLQTLFRRERFTQQLDDELQFHLDEQIAENVAAGMSEEELAIRPYEVLATLQWQGGGNNHKSFNSGAPGSAHNNFSAGGSSLPTTHCPPLSTHFPP